MLLGVDFSSPADRYVLFKRLAKPEGWGRREEGRQTNRQTD